MFKLSNVGPNNAITTHDREWFIPPIKMVMSGGWLIIVLPTLISNGDN